MIVASEPDRRIEARTSRGAVWAIAASASSAPFAFGITLVLARVSPSTLGFYALVTLLVSVCSALMSVGGPAVASRFAPLLGSIPNVVTVRQAGAGATVAVTCAVGLGLVSPHPFGVSWWWFLALAPAVSLWIGMQGSLTSELRFGRASAVQNVPTFFQFLFFGVLFLAARGVLRDHARSDVVLSYLVPVGAFAAWYAARLVRFARAQRIQASLPAGFWRYAAGVQAIVALTLVFEMSERGVAALNGNDLRTLGVYFAALQTAQIVRRVPAIVGQAYLPGFAALAGHRRSEILHRFGSRAVGLVGFSVGTALALSKGLVGPVFGAEYRSASTALALLALAYAATAASALDCSYATAAGRLGLYQAGLIAGSLAFIPLIWIGGVLPFAVTRAVALIVLQVVVVAGLRHAWSTRSRHLVATLVIGGVELVAVNNFGSPIAIAVIWLCGLAAYWVTVGLPLPTPVIVRRAVRAHGVVD